MTRGKARYLSYLLRLWQVSCDGRLVWRASLESAKTGERTGFLSLEALYAFLERQVLAAEPGPANRETAERGAGVGGADGSRAP